MSLQSEVSSAGKDRAEMKHQFRGSVGATLPVFMIMDKEDLDIKDRYTLVKTRDINNSFVLSHPTNGTLGGTIGDFRGSWGTQRVLQSGNVYREWFYDDEFNDSGVTTASWDTTNHRITFVPSNIAQSGTIYQNQSTITQAILTIDQEYQAVGGTVTDAHSIVFDRTSSVLSDRGFKIKSKIDGNLEELHIHPSCTGTAAVVYNISTVPLGTAVVSGTSATFSPSISISSNQYYYVVVGNLGASYNQRDKTTGGPLPETETNIDYEFGVIYFSGTITEYDDEGYNIRDIVTSTSGGTPSYWLAADGSSWEEVTPDVRHVFATPGTILKWKGSSPTIATISSITIEIIT